MRFSSLALAGRRGARLMILVLLTIDVAVLGDVLLPRAAAESAREGEVARPDDTPGVMTGSADLLRSLGGLGTLDLRPPDPSEMPRRQLAQDPQPTGAASPSSTGSGSGPAELLTNDGVIAMVKAGLSERIIVAKIRSSQRSFDTSADALIRLKSAGVPDAVIEAMLSIPEPAPSTPPPPVTVLPSPSPQGTPSWAAPGRPAPPQTAFRGSQDVSYLSGNGRVPLRGARGKLEMSHMVFVMKVELVISGRRAEYRIQERQPIFHTYYAQPEQIQLARLRVGGKDDRNLKLKSMHAFQFSRTLGYSVDEDDEVKMSVEPDPQGGFRLRPQAPLTPGEYGFVGVWWGAGGVTGFVNVPEFGVD